VSKQAEELRVKQRIDSCFEGLIDRDCEDCLGHGDYGGPCCYGKKFDDCDDEECGPCRHHDDCAEDCGYHLEVEEEEDVRVDPKGNRIRPLGPPIKTSIWDQLRGARERSAAPATVKPTRFTVRPRTGEIPANAPRPAAARIVREDHHKYIPMDDRAPIGEEDPDETAAKRFVKDSTWGGGEGFFRAAYEFFRTHRLR
jgi:hypothetical protein